MDRVQVGVAATFNNPEPNRKQKPHVHMVYSRLHTLHASLQTSIGQKRLEGLSMHHKQAHGTNMYGPALW